MHDKDDMFLDLLANNKKKIKKKVDKGDSNISHIELWNKTFHKFVSENLSKDELIVQQFEEFDRFLRDELNKMVSTFRNYKILQKDNI